MRPNLSEVAEKYLRPVVLDALRAARERLAALDNRNKAALAETIKAIVADYKPYMGTLGQPILVAIAPEPELPPIDSALSLVGRDRTLNRPAYVIELIETRAAHAKSSQTSIPPATNA